MCGDTVHFHLPVISNLLPLADFKAKFEDCLDSYKPATSFHLGRPKVKKPDPEKVEH